jgi:hypothetical protein
MLIYRSISSLLRIAIVGVAAMVLWSRQSTIEMGEKASKMLAMTIVNSDEEVSIDEIPI